MIEAQPQRTRPRERQDFFEDYSVRSANLEEIDRNEVLSDYQRVTVQHRWAALEYIRRSVRAGTSIPRACADVEIGQTTFWRWVKRWKLYGMLGLIPGRAGPFRHFAFADEVFQVACTTYGWAIPSDWAWRRAAAIAIACELVDVLRGVGLWKTEAFIVVSKLLARFNIGPSSTGRFYFAPLSRTSLFHFYPTWESANPRDRNPNLFRRGNSTGRPAKRRETA